MEEMTAISLASAHSIQCDPPPMPGEASGAVLRGLYALVVLTDTSQDMLITFQGKSEGKGLQIGNFI